MNEEQQEYLISGERKRPSELPSRNLKEHMAADDRPREKALRKGFAALSNAELLAAIIGIGVKGESVVELCRRLLRDHDDKLYLLARLSVSDLKRYNGIGEVKAIEILAALELARRYQLEKFDDQFQIQTSLDAYAYLRSFMEHLDHEEIWILTLNRAKRVTDRYKISAGGTASAVGDVKIVLRAAIERLADGIILAHNHPSDTARPSRQDDFLTQQISSGCKAVGIMLLDHIIVCRGGRYYSYMDAGRL